MNFIVSQLVDMFYLTVEGIKATNTFFSSCLQLSNFIGQCIVATCINIVEKVYITLQLLYSVACILYEDYCFFIVDLITKIKWILGGINLTVIYVCTCVQLVASSIKNLYDSVIYFFYSTFELLVTIMSKGGSSIYCALEVIKQALIFTGSSIWYFVSIIPVSIVYAVTLFLCYINETILEFYLALGSVGHAILNSVHMLILFFSDIPGEAAFGLILGLIASCFVVKHCNLLVRLSTIFVSTAMRSYHVMLSIWSIFIDSVTSIFPSLRDEEVHEFPPDHNPTRSSESAACISRCEHQRDFSSKLCIVCQDKEKTVIVLPCRHVCLCSVCCTIIEELYGTCPVCRQRVERTMIVYM